jgi:hypothetical protein
MVWTLTKAGYHLHILFKIVNFNSAAQLRIELRVVCVDRRSSKRRSVLSVGAGCRAVKLEKSGNFRQASPLMTINYMCHIVNSIGQNTDSAKPNAMKYLASCGFSACQENLETAPACADTRLRVRVRRHNTAYHHRCRLATSETREAVCVPLEPKRGQGRPYDARRSLRAHARPNVIGSRRPVSACGSQRVRP